MSGNTLKGLGDDDSTHMRLGEIQTSGLTANVAVVRALQVQIDSLEKVLAKHRRAEPNFRVLATAAGIGAVLATAILPETGDIERFADVGHDASYCRGVGSTHLSHGKKMGDGNTTNGNHPAWAFVEAANVAVRYCEPARRFYREKKASRDSTVAIKSVAHKRARACYHMLEDKDLFSVERCVS